MIVFVVAIDGYVVCANGEKVGFHGFDGRTYRIVGSKLEYQGKMSREHAQNYFEGIFG